MKRNKKVWHWAICLIATSALVACTDMQDANDQKKQPQTNVNAIPVETTSNQLSNDFYRAMIVDGEYETSLNRGVSLDLNSTVNMKDFESGLLEVSRNVFATDKYFFQEGQMISERLARKWLGRKSEENPEGLNPVGNNSDDPNSRVPNYLSQIIEQDYMIQTDKGFELGGIAIGLAMNQVDYYTVKDEQSRIYTYQQELDLETVEKYAQQYGNEIIARLRADNEIESIPIVVGIFIQSPEDSLAGGVYTYDGLSTIGNSVFEWVPRKEKKVIFPTDEDSEDASHFANFKNEIQNFFPNLSGVTAVGHYQDSQLQNLKVDIMTQFYGETEIIAFTQHVTDAASQYLPQNTRIEIKIESIGGIELFVARESKSQTFTYHIFD